MSTSARESLKVMLPKDIPALTTWCRGCGTRILVRAGDRRPDFCRLTCRVRHFWRTAAWRTY
jgi:hypothetical protein